MSQGISSDDDLFGSSNDVKELGEDLFESKNNGKDLEEELFGSDSDQEIGQQVNIQPKQESGQFNEGDESQADHRIVETSLVDLGGPRDNPDLFLLKLPTFLNIETKPFDELEFRNQNHDEDYGLMLENTIRWRKKNNTQESNSRMIRWSDNTFSLLIGEELFDVGTMDIKSRLHFLMSQHPREQFLTTRSRFQKVMTFQPTSTDSLAHKGFMLQLAQKHQKVARAKQFMTLQDPMKLIREQEKLELEKEKAKKKLEAKQRNMMQSMMEQDVYAQGNQSLLQQFDEYDDEFGIIILMIR
jgi:RNA polymerase-associated protein LEO1